MCRSATGSASGVSSSVTFTTTLFDGTELSGVQIDRLESAGGSCAILDIQSRRRPCCRSLDADRRRLGCSDARDDRGWVSTTSTNLLRRLDDNAYVWQSVDRTVGGVAIPDTDEIVIRRQPVTK